MIETPRAVPYLEKVLRWTVGAAARMAMLATLAWVSLAPATAAAAPRVDGRSLTHVGGFELDAVAMFGVTPSPLGGADFAISLGEPLLHVRLGGFIAGGRPFSLSTGEIQPILEGLEADVCAAGYRGRLGGRVCGGVDVGAMHLRWPGFAKAGPRAVPWVAPKVGADLRLHIDGPLELQAGGELLVPVVAPRFSAINAAGERTYAPRSPVAGLFRFGINLRFH